jgi:hypothetical protein
MDTYLQAALAEERQLLARLEAVRAVIRAYGGGTNDHDNKSGVSGNNNEKPRRAPSDKTKRVMSLLAKLLDGVPDPTPTRDLLAFIESEGIQLGGQNSVATLSAMLSRATEFEPVGKSGWRLKSRTPDADTSGAALTGGAATPLFESRQEKAPAD